MSATRDKSQRVTFVYSNLYSIYRKGIERAREGAVRESAAGSPSLGAEALTELAVGRPPAGQKRLAKSFQSGIVIKADDLRNQNQAAPAVIAPPPPPMARVSPYTPAELIGKRVARPASLKDQPASPDAVQSLKQNLESLNDLQARLRFMLKELEDLIKDS